MLDSQDESLTGFVQQSHLRPKKSRPAAIPSRKRKTTQGPTLARERVGRVSHPLRHLPQRKRSPDPAAARFFRCFRGLCEVGFALASWLRYRRRGPSLLVADKARINKRGQAVASRSKTGRNQVTAPIFLLVPQVKLPKRLDLDRDAEQALDGLLGLIVANWVEVRT